MGEMIIIHICMNVAKVKQKQAYEYKLFCWKWIHQSDRDVAKDFFPLLLLIAQILIKPRMRSLHPLSEKLGTLFIIRTSLNFVLGFSFSIHICRYVRVLTGIMDSYRFVSKAFNSTTGKPIKGEHGKKEKYFYCFRNILAYTLHFYRFYICNWEEIGLRRNKFWWECMQFLWNAVIWWGHLERT